MLKVNDITVPFKSHSEGSSFAAVGTIDSHFWFLAHHVDGREGRYPDSGSPPSAVAANGGEERDMGGKEGDW